MNLKNIADAAGQDECANDAYAQMTRPHKACPTHTQKLIRLTDPFPCPTSMCASYSGVPSVSLLSFVFQRLYAAVAVVFLPAAGAASFAAVAIVYAANYHDGIYEDQFVGISCACSVSLRAIHDENPNAAIKIKKDPIITEALRPAN